MTIKKWVEKLYTATTSMGDEEKTLLRFISSLKPTPGTKVLDVGCGFGRKLEVLAQTGADLTGVDINPDMVKKNRLAGFNCMTVEEFNATTDTYDVMLMSHIIEHLRPHDLLEFMDNHLDRLRPGGHLIIITPLYSPYFYDDFDHEKPYHPASLNMVFGSEPEQARSRGKNKLELTDIWFRKGPFTITHAPGMYVQGHSRMPFAINFTLVILFRLSFSLIGRTNGWMGMYRKK